MPTSCCSNSNPEGHKGRELGLTSSHGNWSKSLNLGTLSRPKASISAVSLSTLDLFSGRASMYSVNAREFAVVSYAAQQGIYLRLHVEEDVSRHIAHTACSDSTASR